MKKNYRRQYLKYWLDYLKGKNEIDTKTLALFLGKKMKGAYSPPTLKRYNSTLLANLFGNGYIEGKKKKTFVGAILPIVKEITLPVLDQCLTRDFGKVQITEGEKKKISKKTVKKAGEKLPVAKGRKNDLLAMGRSSFLYVQQLTQQVEELERQVSGYERIFENLRQLFGREVEEMEEWILKVLQ